MMNYKEIENDRGETYIELSYEDGRVSHIPCDPANSDYQTYLRWLNGEDEAQSL